MQALQQAKPFLLKLDGDWGEPTTRVLTLTEYNAAYGSATGEIDYTLPIPTLLNALLSTRCCLFLGCSLHQDRTVAILRRIARQFEHATHYAIVERPADGATFVRRAAELSGQGIRPIWFSQSRFDLIEPILAYLADRCRELLAAPGTRPPPASSVEIPNNIPPLAGATIGREQEVEHVVSILRGARLLNISGAGGCGKSRLAIEVALALKTEFPDGVWFVELADLSPRADLENLLPSRIGRIAGVTEQPTQPPHEALVEHFSRGSYLLILDNCEHLITSTVSLVKYLLAKCPRLKILVTSRSFLLRSRRARLSARSSSYSRA